MQASLAALRVAPLRARGAIVTPLLAPLGASLFGLAMAFSAPGDSIAISALSWALALPLLSAFTWLICLPALYIPWAARESRLSVAIVGNAAFEAMGVFGACLGATAPIQWFFAATASGSALPGGLAVVFVWLALLASGMAFVRALGSHALFLSPWWGLAFFTLFAATFFQFGHVVGLPFFGA